jgi:hypothetical protein
MKTERNYASCRVTVQAPHNYLINMPDMYFFSSDNIWLKSYPTLVDEHLFAHRRAVHVISNSVQTWRFRSVGGIYTANGGNIQLSANISQVCLVVSLRYVYRF